MCAQYQDRRRLAMSSFISPSPAPNRLGHGITLRATTSTSPRKAMTARKVTTRETHRGQPSILYNSRKKAGAVRQAMTVATRENMRHWPARVTLRSVNAGGMGRRSSAVPIALRSTSAACAWMTEFRAWWRCPRSPRHEVSANSPESAPFRTGRAASIALLVLALCAIAAPRSDPAPAVPALTDRQLAGQRVIQAFAGTMPPPALVRSIGRGEAAGVILFAPNVAGGPAATRALVGRLQAIPARPACGPRCW